jgi:hypothetical protein
LQVAAAPSFYLRIQFEYVRQGAVHLQIQAALFVFMVEVQAILAAGWTAGKAGFVRGNESKRNAPLDRLSLQVQTARISSVYLIFLPVKITSAIDGYFTGRDERPARCTVREVVFVRPGWIKIQERASPYFWHKVLQALASITPILGQVPTSEPAV